MSGKRKAGESGIHHVMTRGVAQMEIFHDERDRRHYLRKLKELIARYEVEMLAWCLMDNHVHLLPKSARLECISSMMRDLSSDYASYYNWRYGRKGHLVQGRFASKPVEDESYLMTVVRYIHRNPIGKITTSCDYQWSSYPEYVGRNPPVIATIGGVLAMFGSREEFIRFHGEEGEPDGLLDPDRGVRLSDDEAHEIATKMLGLTSASNGRVVSGKFDDEVLQLLHEQGLSYRQIAEETGVNRNRVAYACMRKKPTKGR